MSMAGEYSRALARFEECLIQSQREGRIPDAVRRCTSIARCCNALGRITSAQKVYERGRALAARLSGPAKPTLMLRVAWDEMLMVSDEGWEQHALQLDSFIQQPAAEDKWSLARIRAAAARAHARLGEAEQALLLVGTLTAPIEHTPSWAPTYPLIPCDAAECLWLLARTDHIDVIERNLRDKVLGPDFRYPMRDARLSIAQLSALRGRYDAAVEWFAKAREVLDLQGARPLRAIVDYDEALMYVRRADPGDATCATLLLEAALAQFRALGMPGWIRRAGSLLRNGKEWRPPILGKERDPEQPQSVLRNRQSAIEASSVFRREGEYWTLAYSGKTARLRHTKGLSYIAHLLAEPGREVHVRDLAAMDRRDPVHSSSVPDGSGLGTVLDARATAQYKRRLAEARQELDEATAAGDLGHAARIQHEIAAITQQLTAAYGLGGRARKAGDPTERVRKAVTNQIRRSLHRIQGAHPELGRHLTNGLRTGFVCAYNPERLMEWRL
jgi:tetratricopeptide (TPR) repeat protein